MLRLQNIVESANVNPSTLDVALELDSLDGTSVVDDFLTDDNGTPLYTDVSASSEPLPTNPGVLARTFSRLSTSTVDSVAPHLSANRGGRTMPLSELCDIIHECDSLERAQILSVECHRERSSLGVLHRTLLFELRRAGRRDIWLRVDRLRAEGVPLRALVFKGGKTEANDVARLAVTKAELLKRRNARPENRIEFAVAPSLGTFRSCFRAICDELLEYHVWPENCWFMCSLLQEHLVEAGSGSVVSGSLVNIEPESSIRSEIWARRYHSLPKSAALEQMLSLSGIQDAPRDLQLLMVTYAKHRTRYHSESFPEHITELADDISSIEIATFALVPEHITPLRAVELVLALESALCRQDYSVSTLETLEELASLGDLVVSSRLRVISLIRKLYTADLATHWHTLASHLVRLSRIASLSDPSISNACRSEARVVIARSDRTQLWSDAQVFDVHPAWMKTMSISPDGKYVALSSSFTIRLWDLVTGKSVGEPFQGHTDHVESVAFSSNGEQLVSGSTDSTVMRWSVASGEALGPPLHHFMYYTLGSNTVKAVAFSPDGRIIASGGTDAIIQLWDASTGEKLQRHWMHQRGWVMSLAFSSDSSVLVTGAGDRTVRLWEVSTGDEKVQALKGHTDIVNSVAFSPDGKLVVSGARDCTLRRWDAITGNPVGGAMVGHSGWVQAVAFSPDGRTIASASADCTIILWDALSGERVGKLYDGHTRWVVAVTFSPDGRQIISGYDGGNLRLWDSLDLDKWPEAS